MISLKSPAGECTINFLLSLSLSLSYSLSLTTIIGKNASPSKHAYQHSNFQGVIITPLVRSI